MNEDAISRPRHTIHAAELLHDHAASIAQVCADACEDEVVLAEVDRFLSFGGARRVQRSQLAEQAATFDTVGWTLVFSPGVGVDEIEDRSMELARQAFRRWEAWRRWCSKHRA